MSTEAKHNSWYAAGDPWVLTQTEWNPEKNIYFETIFTQANGYMGIRGYTEETNDHLKACREGYLAGVFGHIDDAALQQVRIDYPWPMVSMITLPELFGCEVVLNGEAFKLAQGTIAFFSRSLNMRNGVLSRNVVWVSPRGQRTRLLFERFLSAAVPHLALQQITITPENWSGAASLHFALDGAYPTYFRCGDRAMAHLPQDILRHQHIDADPSGTATLRFETKGTGHTVGLASALGGAGRVALASSPAVLKQEVSINVQEGIPCSALHAVAVVTSRDREVEPAGVARLAADIAREAVRAGYERSLAESQVVWDFRWARSDVAIEGPARDQAYLRFSAFSMLQMAPFHTDNMSVPARAYAYNRYHGLYYWDSETFLLPCYLHTHPEVAEHLLNFRYRTLPGARRTAQRLQSPGACFPWMTDADDGTEQAPWGIGDYVWHQNADIAYAIDQYVQATGDTRFMLEKGLETMVESARFWMSRVEEDAEGVVHLHDTVGPDELDKHGKDNGYTSLMARRHLRLAGQWIKHLNSIYPREAAVLVERLDITAAEKVAWQRAADRLAVPMVPGHTFPLQDEFLLAKEPLSFEGLTADEAFAKRHTHRVVKQADIIVAMYLLQDEFTVDQMRDAYDFYEPMTLHYSSLSYNTHSIIATKIGREQQAYEYFMKAAGLDLDDLRNATTDGLHAAALGGTWQTVAYGFLGLRLAPEGLILEPRLPAAWKSIALCLAYRGYLLHLKVGHDAYTVEVEDLEGQGLARVILNGEAHDLRDGLVIASAPAEKAAK